MAKLTAADRRAIPAGELAGPGRSFPIEDDNHARAALQDVGKSERAGHITATIASVIRARARAKLGVGGKKQ